MEGAGEAQGGGRLPLPPHHAPPRGSRPRAGSSPFSSGCPWEVVPLLTGADTPRWAHTPQPPLGHLHLCDSASLTLTLTCACNLTDQGWAVAAALLPTACPAHRARVQDGFRHNVTSGFYITSC